MHDNEIFLAGMQMRGVPEEKIQSLREQYPPAVHPVVRTHPVSKRRSIYVNSIFTRSIVGLSDEDSKALLQKLFIKAWVPDYQCRFRWGKDSFTFWDNRAVQHYAAADYWPEARKMERVTVMGDKPS